jgi:hypothetical protein
VGASKYITSRGRDIALKKEAVIFVSGKRYRCYRASMGLRRAALVWLRATGSSSPEEAKYLDVAL